MKNIPAEGKIPEPGKLLWYLQKKSLMERCVDSTRDVTFCHCCIWIFSYEDVMYAVDIRHKRSFDRSATRLELIIFRILKNSNIYNFYKTAKYVRFPS